MKAEENYKNDIDNQYIESLKKYPVLDSKQTIDLFKQYYLTRDDKIKTQIFEGNLRLVIYALRLYHCNCYIQYMDLIQEGNMGLLEAIEKFDINKQKSFASFAHMYIKAHLSRFIAENVKTEHIPEYKVMDLYRYVAQKNVLSSKLDRNPSEEEMAYYLNVNILTVHEFEQLMNANISLNQKTEDGAEIGDFISDNNSLKFIEKVENEELNHIIINCLNDLDNLERIIVLLISGLYENQDAMTFDKAAIFIYDEKIVLKKISRETVRKIYEKAIRKLRLSKNLKELKDFDSTSLYMDNDDKKNILMFSLNESIYNDYQDLEINDYLRVGNYKEARKLIERLEPKNKNLYLKYMALIEKIENNYENSIKCYEELLKYSHSDLNIFYELSFLYIQVGDIKSADAILNSLNDNDNNQYKTKIYMVYAYILQNKYYDAFKLLSSIDRKKLSINELYIYENVFTFVISKLRKHKHLNSYDDYLSYMIKNNKKNISELTNHIYNSCGKKVFIDNEDELKNMIIALNNKIKIMEGNHMGFFDTYKISLDYPIGYIGGSIAKDVCVATIVGTKQIVYAFPVILSNEFNKDRGEKNELRRKL